MKKFRRIVANESAAPNRDRLYSLAIDDGVFAEAVLEELDNCRQGPRCLDTEIACELTPAAKEKLERILAVITKQGEN
jgi:hypothetical protein